MQYNLFTLVNQKKYEFIFDFGEEKNKEIMILKKNIKKIAEKLKVEQKNIIFTNIHEGSLGVSFKNKK